MSSGLYRKQYEAVKAIARGRGISFSTPEGSFNQKFVAMCKIIVDDSGTFVPTKGAEFHTRKADGLRQVAEELGASVSTGLGYNANMIKSAKAIWDLGNDGETPDIGGNDWRVYQLLYHSDAALLMRYGITAPTAPLRTFDPNTDTIQNAYDLMATLIRDTQGTYGSYSITAPSGGWLRTFNPATATVQNFFDVLATLAEDLTNTAGTYTITPPASEIRTFDPSTDSIGTAYGLLATFIIDLQTLGLVS